VYTKGLNDSATWLNSSTGVTIAARPIQDEVPELLNPLNSAFRRIVLKSLPLTGVHVSMAIKLDLQEALLTCLGAWISLVSCRRFCAGRRLIGGAAVDPE